MNTLPRRSSSRRLHGAICLVVTATAFGIAWPWVSDWTSPTARSRLETIETAERMSGDDSPASYTDPQWPNLFGPRHDSSVRLDEPLGHGKRGGFNRLWRVAVGQGYSSPVIARGCLILLHRQGSQELISSYCAQTGRHQWSFGYPTRFACSVEYSAGPYSTPVLDGNRVFALGAEGHLHVLRIGDGSLIWHRDLLRDFDAPGGMFPVGTSPLMAGELLIVAIGGRRPNCGVVALDCGTGRTVWTATADRRGFATPVAATIHGERHILIHSNDALVSLDPADGRVRWRIPFRPKNPDVLLATTPVVAGDLVFATGYQLGAMCVRILPHDQFQVLWTDRRSLDSQHNNLVYQRGKVMGFSAREHALGAVDLATGTWRWKWRSELDRGCLFSLSDQLLVFSETGRLALVDVGDDQAALVALTDALLDAPCYSAPAICGGKLYARNEVELVCLDLRGPSTAAADERAR